MEKAGPNKIEPLAWKYVNTGSLNSYQESYSKIWWSPVQLRISSIDMLILREN